MKVKDLRPNGKVDYLKLKITSLGEVRTFSNGVVQGGRTRDETGTVNIVFFVKDAGRFRTGNIIVIKNGWCKLFRDSLQVQAGKFGKIDFGTEDANPADSEDLSMFKDTHEEKRLKERLKDFGIDEI